MWNGLTENLPYDKLNCRNPADGRQVLMSALKKNSVKKRVSIQKCYREFSGGERKCREVWRRWLLRGAAQRNDTVKLRQVRLLQRKGMEDRTQEKVCMIIGSTRRGPDREMRINGSGNTGQARLLCRGRQSFFCLQQSGGEK